MIILFVLVTIVVISLICFVIKLRSQVGDKPETSRRISENSRMTNREDDFIVNMDSNISANNLADIQNSKIQKSVNAISRPKRASQLA